MHGKAAKKEKTRIHELKKRIDKRKRALAQVKLDWEKRHAETVQKMAKQKDLESKPIP